MKTRILLLSTLVCACSGLSLEDQESILSKEKITTEDVARILQINQAIPPDSEPLEYASFILNGDKWSNIAVKEAGEFKHMSGNDLRDNLAEILEAAKLAEFRQGDIEAAIGAELGDGTTEASEPVTDEATTTTEEPTTTTTVETTTTFNEADIPKEGTVELVIEDLALSPSSMSWSPTQQCLYIADTWALKHIRFSLVPPATTTVAPTEAASETTTEASEPDDTTTAQAAARSEAPVTEEVTTALPTTAAPESPFDIRYLDILRENFFPVFAGLAYDQAYPLAVPIYDVDNVYNGEVGVAVGKDIFITSFESENGSNKTIDGSQFNSLSRGSMQIPFMHIMTPGWVDPKGRLITGTYDIRPILKRHELSKMCLWDNILECNKRSLATLEVCHPTGIAFSRNNATMYVADAYLRAVLAVSYNIDSGVSGSVTKEMTLQDLIEEEKGIPAGLATDENGHIWLGVAGLQDGGKVIEINPHSAQVISSIDIPDSEIIDVVFAGEEFEYMYVLTKNDLYKVSELGVLGAPVSDFRLVEYD